MMAKNILSVDEIKKSVVPICRRYGINRAYLYGSYARSEATENSDLDIRIEKGNLRGIFALCGFRQDIVDALQKKVDVISQLPDRKDFLDSITRDEVLIYEA